MKRPFSAASRFRAFAVLLISLSIAGLALFVLFSLIAEEPAAPPVPIDEKEGVPTRTLFPLHEEPEKIREISRVEIGPPVGISGLPAIDADRLLNEFLLCSEIEDFRDLAARWGSLDPVRAPLFASLIERGSSLDPINQDLLHEVVCRTLETMKGPESAARLLFDQLDGRLPPIVAAFLASTADAAALRDFVLEQHDVRILLDVPAERLEQFDLPGIEALLDPGDEASEEEEDSGSYPVWHWRRAGLVRCQALKGDAGAVAAISMAFLDPDGDRSLQRAGYGRFKASAWPRLLEGLPASELERLLILLQARASRVDSLKLELVLDLAAAGFVHGAAQGVREAALRLMEERPDLRVKAAAAYVGAGPGAIEAGSDLFAEIEARGGGDDAFFAEAARCLPVIRGLEFLAAHAEAAPPEEQERLLDRVKRIDAFLFELIQTRFMEPATADKIRCVPEAGDLAVRLCRRPWPLDMQYYPRIVQTALDCYLRSLAGEPRRDFNGLLEGLQIESAISLPGHEGELCAAAYAQLILPLLPLDIERLEVMLRNPALLEKRSAAFLLLFLERCATIRREAAHPLLDEYLDLHSRLENQRARQEALRLAFRAAMTGEEINGLFNRSIRADDEDVVAMACEEIPLLYGQGLVGIDCIVRSIRKAVREGSVEQVKACFDTFEDSLPGFMSKEKDVQKLAGFLAEIKADPGLDQAVAEALSGLLRDIDKIRSKEE